MGLWVAGSAVTQAGSFERGSGSENEAHRHSDGHRLARMHPRGCTRRLKPPTQISPAQFLSLMSNLPLRERLAVSLNGWLGTRASETFGLKWEDLDLQLGKVSFRRGFACGRFSRLKTEASRTDFSLPEEVVELLARWHARTPYNRPTDFVFASPRTKGQRPFWPRGLMRNIQPVARALGLPHIGWHTLRHSYAAWAKGARLHLEEIKTLLRHQTLRMTSEEYGRVELEEKRQLQSRVVTYVKKKARGEGKPDRRGAYVVRKTA